MVLYYVRTPNPSVSMRGLFPHLYLGPDCVGVAARWVAKKSLAITARRSQAKALVRWARKAGHPGAKLCRIKFLAPRA